MAVWLGFFLVVVATPVINAQDSIITTGGCGTTKGCFRSPNDCSGPIACDFFLTWRPTGDGNIIFEMSGKAESYVAVGFSKSGFMRNSDVYACTVGNAVVRSRNTVGNTNVPNNDLKGVSVDTVRYYPQQGGELDERIECNFTRQAAPSDLDDTYFDLSGNNYYHIIMAKSNSPLNNGNIVYHNQRVKGELTRFSDIMETTIAVDTEKKLQKTHGSLMIIAWVGLASIGITMARYFKPLSSGRKICGKPVWFAVHRLVMTSALLFTIIAFIIIFVAVEGFVEKGQGVFGRTRYTHAIFGIIVTILAIVNPIMAFFRPHPGEPKRPIFNWAHRTVGMSAHVLAMITICLGLRPGLIDGLQSYTFAVMIVFIVLHFVMWIIMEVVNFLKSDSTSGVSVQNTAEPNSDKSPEKDSTTTNMLFFTYLVFVIIFVFIIFISVAAA